MKSNVRQFIEKRIPLLFISGDAEKYKDDLEKELLEAIEKDKGDGWVKIEDGCKFPDYDHPVLWLCENGNMRVEALDKDGNPWLLKDEDPDDVWGYMGTKATHWKELPQPPKQ